METRQTLFSMLVRYAEAIAVAEREVAAVAEESVGDRRESGCAGNAVARGEVRGIRIRDRHVELEGRAGRQCRSAHHRLCGRAEDLRNDDLAVRCIQMELVVVVEIRVQLRVGPVDIVLLHQVVVRDVVVGAGEVVVVAATHGCAAGGREVGNDSGSRHAEFRRWLSHPARLAAARGVPIPPDW